MKDPKVVYGGNSGRLNEKEKESERAREWKAYSVRSVVLH